MNGCSSSDDVTITVSSIPQIMFQADTLNGCAPLIVTFTNLSTGNSANCFWDFGNGITTQAVNCGSVTNTYDYAGSFAVNLTVTTTDGCTGSEMYPDYINVFEQPIASFSIDNQTISQNDLLVNFTNSSLNASNYTWVFGDGSANSNVESPAHEFFESTLNGYTSLLIADNGGVCVDSVQIYIPIIDELIFYVPNAFTPNDDKYNNSFVPVFTSGFDPYAYHMLIFNRWGEIIFESYNAEKGWDGTYGDNVMVEDGVYIWKIVFKESKTDKKHEEVGHITLLR